MTKATADLILDLIEAQPALGIGVLLQSPVDMEKEDAVTVFQARKEAYDDLRKSIQ